MDTFELPLQVRWSDLDPNFHVRHSVYYDWGALCRIELLNSLGLSWKRMQELAIGPILFREECQFRREIRLDDQPKINMELLKARRDFSRFTIQHTIWKNKETLSAVLTVDIAWINGLTRKLATLPPAEVEKLAQTPMLENFAWE